MEYDQDPYYEGSVACVGKHVRLSSPLWSSTASLQGRRGRFKDKVQPKDSVAAEVGYKLPDKLGDELDSGVASQEVNSSASNVLRLPAGWPVG